HSVRSLTHAFWNSMHDGLAQLNSPRDCLTYARYASGLPATSRESRTRHPWLSRCARSAASFSACLRRLSPSGSRSRRYNASSSGWLVWRGRSTKSRKDTRFVLSRRTVSPFRSTFNQLAEDQLETVVKASDRASWVTGQRSRQTGGRMCVHRKPQSEKRAAGVPTVSPVVR